MDSKSMQWKIKGNLKKVKGALKQKYGKLTDDDFLVEEGKTDEWIGKLQHKLGKTREEIVGELDEILA
jgi:uncharacterized protein YjbJ (UPF0337 family)